jgi:multidrug efflux pump
VIGGILASTVVAIFFAPLYFWMLESLSARFGGKKAAPGGTAAQGGAPAPARGGAAPAAAPHAEREGD